MGYAFTYFNIYNRVYGGTFLEWGVTPSLRISSPIAFSVYFSRTTSEDDWQLLGTVTDIFYYVDTEQRQYGLNHNSYYKVTFTVDGVTYSSPIRQTNRIFNTDRENNITAEILRKELLLLKQYSGTCGYLYKRKQWGQVCPSCTDYDSNEVVNNNCETCYGVGLVGGYFKPLLYYFAFVQEQPLRKVSVPEGRGVVQPVTVQARGVNCPWLDTGDLWIDAWTDDRYIIQTLSYVHFRGVPLIVMAELRLLPKSEFLYRIPRPEDDIMSSSVSG